MFAAVSAFTALATLAVSSVSAAPTNMTTRAAPANITTRAAAPAAPHFVVYNDIWLTGGAPPVDQLKGFNTYALAFWLESGPFDNAQAWADLAAADKTALKQSYTDAGISPIVSAFGATDVPTASDPTTVANNLAAFVKDQGLDGVDVDYEDYEGFNAGTGAQEQWLIDFTKALRAQLPQGEFILTHAPLAPWFSPSKYPAGGYLKVHQEVGDLIDWYNLQYYNQGEEYATCDTLVKASAAYPGSAVLEIVAAGVPAEKVVIGKPGTAADAPSGGFIDTATLAGCVSQAKAGNWNGGVMAWQFPHADTAWISAVRGDSFPL